MWHHNNSMRKLPWHCCEHQDSDSSKKNYGHHKVQLPVTLLTTFVSRLLPVHFIYLKIRIYSRCTKVQQSCETATAEAAEAIAELCLYFSSCYKYSFLPSITHWDYCCVIFRLPKGRTAVISVHTLFTK